MIGNKLEQSIINAFQEDLSSTHSINHISQLLKKSYPVINKKSNFFLQEGILKKLDIGRSYQCFLNLKSDKARVLMTLNEINRKESFIAKNKNFENVIDELLQIAKKYPIDTILLYKKTLIFVTDATDKKNEIMELSVLTKDYTLLFFTKHRFQEYFIENKDLQRYHLVFHNADIYLNIIAEVADKLLISGILNNKQSITMRQDIQNKSNNEK
jgi:hypothetical protein